MPLVRFTPLARREVLDGFDWYEERAVGLGSRFSVAVEMQVARIAKIQHQFPIVYRDIRRALVRKFPYSLFFWAQTEEAIVIACFHASRDPREWQSRN